MPGSAMAAQKTLTLLVYVRIVARQPKGAGISVGRTVACNG